MSDSLVKTPSVKISTLMMTQSIASGVIGLLFWVSLARFMSIAEFGELSAARSVLSIAIMLSSLGMGTTVTKVFSKSYAEKEWDLSRGLRKSAPLFILGASLICFLVLVGYHSTIHDKTAVRLESFIAVMALLPLYALAGFFSFSASAHGAPARSAAIHSWGWASLSLAVLWIFAAIEGRSIGVIGAAGIMGIVATIALFLLWSLTIKIEPKEIKTGTVAHANVDWLMGGLAIALAGLSATVLDRGGLIVLGWVHADAEAAARLSAAGKLSFLILLIAFGLGGLYKPLFARAVAEKNPKHVRKLLFAWFRSTAIPVVVMGALLIVGGKFFLGLYGEEYKAGYWTLVVYVINYGVGALVYMSRSLYQFLGCSKQVLIIMGCAAVFGVAGMVVLGGIWSDFGVALATAISLNTGTLLILVLCFRKLKAL